MKADFTNVKMLPNQDISIRLTSVHKQSVDKGWDVGVEKHSSFEIIKIIKGEQSSFIENKEILLKKNDILFIPPQLDHHNVCKSELGLSYFCIHFYIDDPFLKYVLKNSFPYVMNINNPNHNKINDILKKWIIQLDEWKDMESLDNLKIQYTFLELLIALAEVFTKPDVNLPTIEFNYANLIANEIKKEFRAFIDPLNIDKMNKVSIGAAISNVGISHNHAINVFKQVYGITPKKYLDNLKFQEAKNLLQSSLITIAEISEKLGYSTPSHFSRQFKTWSGLSPFKYKKKLH